MNWPDVVAVLAVVLVVAGVIGLMIHDGMAGRRRKPPETLGKKERP